MNSTYVNTSCFTSLPIDIVRIISTYLPPKASVSLMLSCRRILIALKRDRLLWRSILHQLEIHFEERDFDETSDNYWFCSPFRQFVDIRRRFLTYQATTTQKNHRLYYNIRFEPQENLEDKKNIVHTRKNRGHKQETMERLIEHSTIVYDYDESFFVLIQSIDRSEFWQSYKHTISVASVPVHSRASVYNIRHGSCQYRGSLDLPFEVAAQDVKVDRGMLFLLPIKHLNSDDDPSEILLVYDISDGETGNVLEQKASFCLTPSVECPERYRMPPSVYKESGEKRIYILNQENQNTSFMNILIIVPCPIWTVLVIKLSVPDGRMTLWKEEHLTNACYDAMGQLFTADQKNNTVAVALYASPTSARRYKSLIAVIDVPPTPNDLDGNHVYFSKESQHTPTIDILSGNTLPDFLSDSFDLYGRVQDMKLYYVSATNYYHSSKDTGIIHEKAQKRGKKQGYYAPILVFLLASDKIVLYSSHNPDGQHLDLQVLLGSNNRFNSKNWHYSELQVQDKSIVIHQIREGNSHILSVNLLTMSLEWTLRPSELPSLNHGDRYYLHCDFDLVWISDSRQSVLLSSASGKPIGYLTYPEYEKTVPEISWQDEDTSPYAQTGNSVWEIGSRLGKYFINNPQKSPFIVIIHDIERCNPIAADLLIL